MEEVEDVKGYIDVYCKWKDTNKDVAKIFYDIAVQELEHAKKLHGVLATLIPGASPEQVYLIKFMQSLNTKQIQEASVMVNLYKA
jgi:rubrerythrin